MDNVWSINESVKKDLGEELATAVKAPEKKTQRSRSKVTGKRDSDLSESKNNESTHIIKTSSGREIKKTKR
jgi:hypothetical protein